MPFHADVLEVIAEHACGTVADACALRGSCKGYRRAVDTTVRRLVYEDQPELQRQSNLTQPPLQVASENTHLDAVRIAFTCDEFPKIARLVVVAFALDGAKDELHEAYECGERPVESSDGAVDMSLPADPSAAGRSACCNPSSLWARHAPTPIHVALRRCSVSATLTLVVDGHELPAAPDSFPRLERLTVEGRMDVANARRLASSLRVFGHQLTTLTLAEVDNSICGSITLCGSLTTFTANAIHTTEAASALCDALIASGAPLQKVELATQCVESVRRLLIEVPTIVKATAMVDLDDIPTAVQDRLNHFNYAAFRLPRSRSMHVADGGDWSPSEHATQLTVRAAGGGASLPVTDFASSFPNLCDVTFQSVDHDNARLFPLLLFPASVTAVRADVSRGEDGTALLRCLNAHGSAAGLPRLSQVRVSLLTQVSPYIDITPLVAFAATLTHLVVDTDTDDAAECSRIEAALSQLVALEHAWVPQLHSMRCFLGGRHARLRSLAVASVVGSPEAPFAELAKACPRLVQVKCAAPPPDQLPAGWAANRSKYASSAISLTRVSFQ